MAEHTGKPVRVFIVWEPVLFSDWMAPSTATLNRVVDGRAQQYWDRGRLLSKAMGETDRDSIVWDTVSVYAPGAVWEKQAPPAPRFSDGPVVRVIPALTKAVGD